MHTAHIQKYCTQWYGTGTVETDTTYQQEVFLVAIKYVAPRKVIWWGDTARSSWIQLDSAANFVKLKQY